MLDHGQILSTSGLDRLALFGELAQNPLALKSGDSPTLATPSDFGIRRYRMGGMRLVSYIPFCFSRGLLKPPGGLDASRVTRASDPLAPPLGQTSAFLLEGYFVLLDASTRANFPSMFLLAPWSARLGTTVWAGPFCGRRVFRLKG